MNQRPESDTDEQLEKVIDDFYQPVREEIATRKEIDALEGK